MSPKAKVSKTNPKRQQIKGTNIFPLTIFKPAICQLANPNLSTRYPELVNSPTQTSQLTNPNLSTYQPQSVNSPIQVCQLFGTDFNIMSAFFVHQPLTLPQKNDSREGLFRCQKGVVVHAGKMNFYLSQPPPTPVLGRFAAKCSVFWCKTRCNMPLNAVRFGAKRKLFWC